MTESKTNRGDPIQGGDMGLQPGFPIVLPTFCVVSGGRGSHVWPVKLRLNSCPAHWTGGKCEARNGNGVL